MAIALQHPPYPFLRRRPEPFLWICRRNAGQASAAIGRIELEKKSGAYPFLRARSHLERHVSRRAYLFLRARCAVRTLPASQTVPISAALAGGAMLRAAQQGVPDSA